MKPFYFFSPMFEILWYSTQSKNQTYTYEIISLHACNGLSDWL